MNDAACSGYPVDADGDLDRYRQECMLVHDEWVIFYCDQIGWYRRSQSKLLSLSLE